LPQRISILIACGNSICGNSAIAAVAPIIGADSDDVASSIAFTAILGVVVVLALPLLIPLLYLSQSQYGVLAGLTVYAVPQVLAATLPISPVSAQLGTMVKLMRVLMLGPVVVLLSLLLPKLNICARRPAPFKRRHLVSLVYPRLSRPRGVEGYWSHSAIDAGPNGCCRELADNHIDGRTGSRRRHPQCWAGWRHRHLSRGDIVDRPHRHWHRNHLASAPSVRSFPLGKAWSSSGALD